MPDYLRHAFVFERIMFQAYFSLIGLAITSAISVNQKEKGVMRRRNFGKLLIAGSALGSVGYPDVVFSSSRRKTPFNLSGTSFFPISLNQFVYLYCLYRLFR